MTSIHAGLMVPANNTTFENEILQWLPAGSKVTTAKIARGSELMTLETLPQYNQRALDAAEMFRNSEVDILLYGCTAAGFMGGPEVDRRLGEDLHAVTGKAVTTTASSMVLTLRQARVRKLALVTPYQDGLNTQLRRYLSEEGFEVARFDSFYASSVEALGCIDASQVFDMAMRTAREDCDGLFIACAQLPTAGILSRLQEELRMPVFSSNSSCVKQATSRLRALTD